MAVNPSTASDPEQRLYDRLKQASAQITARSGTLGTTTAQSRATGLARGVVCVNDPGRLDLRERIEWNSRLVQCLQSAAAEFELLAIELSGPDAVAAAQEARDLRVLASQGEEQQQQRTSEGKFLGHNWGIGFGVSHAIGDDIIDDATLVDGVVRANKEKTLLPRAVFEFHNFLNRQEKTKDGRTITLGHGPFVAVTATADELLAGFGLGYMWGWKDHSLPTDSQAFTIGIGVMLDGEVRSLADGFEENKPLPAGETGIRFKEEARPSFLLLVTRAF